MAEIIQKKKYADLPQTTTLKDNDMVMISDGTNSKVITADNLKTEITKDVQVDTTNLVTKPELATGLSTKSDTGHNHDTAYATKSSEHTHSNKAELDKIQTGDKAKWDAKAEVSAIPTKTSQLTNDSSFVNQTQVDTSVNTALSNSITSGGIKAELDKKANKTDVYTISEVNALIDGVNAGDVDLTNYYNKTEVDAKDNLKVDKVAGKQLSTEDFTTAEKAKLYTLQNADVTKAYVDTELAKKSGVGHNHVTGDIENFPVLSNVATSGDYNDLSNKPTGLSEFTNDAHLATESFVTNKIAEAQLGGGDVDLSGLATVDQLNTKVDKVTGKSLISDTEITRLAGVTNYTHPSTHAPSIITQDASNRFVTDTEKATWNAKVSSITTVNAKALSSNVVLNGADLLATGYTKATVQSAIAVTDSLNVAIGKLEKKADDNITAITGKVSTTTTVNSKPLSANVTLSLDDIADGTTRQLANYQTKVDNNLTGTDKTLVNVVNTNISKIDILETDLNGYSFVDVPTGSDKELFLEEVVNPLPPEITTGDEGKIISVKADGSGLEYVDKPTIPTLDLTSYQQKTDSNITGTDKNIVNAINSNTSEIDSLNTAVNAIPTTYATKEDLQNLALESGNIVIRDVVAGEIFVLGTGGTVTYGQIVVSKTSTTIVEGGSDTFTVALDQAPTNNQIVTLSKTNSDVALSATTLTFTPSNYATPQTVTITVAEDNTDYSNETDTITLTSPGVTTKTIAVTITDNDTAPTVSVTDVTLDKSTTTVNVGSTDTLTPTITPSNASNKNVTWTSSNTAIATVSGGVVTGVANGTTTITCTTVDGNYTATCSVTVQTATISVTGVSVSPTTATLTSIGATQQLTATITPTNATNKNVTWTSSNTSVATVSSTGLVTSVAAGSSTITVTTADGGFTATCGITVSIATATVCKLDINGANGYIEDATVGTYGAIKLPDTSGNGHDIYITKPAATTPVSHVVDTNDLSYFTLNTNVGSPYITQSSLFQGNIFTWEFVIQNNAIATSSIVNNNKATSGYDVSFVNGKLAIRDGTYLNTVSTDTYNANTKIHVLFECDYANKVANLYVNNVLVKQNTNTGAFKSINLGNLAIGDTSSNKSVKYYRIRFYDKLLTASEKTASYNTLMGV